MEKKWYEEGADWGEEEEPWNEIDNFDKVLLDKINILDILDKYEIEYTRISAGNFTHKLRCPFPNHLSGNEKTASLYISENNNDFHCFGCNSNGTLIEFIMLFLGVPYYRATEILSKFAEINIDDIDEELIRPKVRVDPSHTIMPYIFDTGVRIRKFLNNTKDSSKYEKWCFWAEKQFKKLDYYLDTLDDSQWEKAKKYSIKIKEYLDKKEYVK